MTAEETEGTPLPTPVRRRRPAPPVAPSRPVALVGLPGSGKSTVARLLAERLGWRWMDVDERIEAVSGQSIPELFARGENHFRTLETEVLRGVLAIPTELVMATGGGIVTSEANRATLASRATVVWLDLDVEAVAQRLAADQTPRPLLAGTDADVEVRLAELAVARQPLYEAVAAHRVDAAASPERVAEAIATLLDALPEAQTVVANDR